jgi:uncharacterized protein YeaC (DUF1315 family)
LKDFLLEISWRRKKFLQSLRAVVTGALCVRAVFKFAESESFGVEFVVDGELFSPMFDRLSKLKKFWGFGMKLKTEREWNCGKVVVWWKASKHTNAQDSSFIFDREIFSFVMIKLKQRLFAHLPSRTSFE